MVPTADTKAEIAPAPTPIAESKTEPKSKEEPNKEVKEDSNKEVKEEVKKAAKTEEENKEKSGSELMVDKSQPLVKYYAIYSIRGYDGVPGRVNNIVYCPELSSDIDTDSAYVSRYV